MSKRHLEITRSIEDERGQKIILRSAIHRQGRTRRRFTKTFSKFDLKLFSRRQSIVSAPV